jgi:4-hydroxybenzoate polyprenyltransferase
LKLTTIAIFVLFFYQWIVVNHAFTAAADHADDSVAPLH